MNACSRILDPQYDALNSATAYSDRQRKAGGRISAYLQLRTDEARAAFATVPSARLARTDEAVDAIVSVLLHGEFNHQAKGRVSHLLPEVRRRIGVHAARGTPIQLFMSYNGGYHATTQPDLTEPLDFAASTAELLFLHMVARLKSRLLAVYPPGMTYHVVLNNGVAHYVNDIPVERTEGYARDLSAMIAALGGARDVSVLVQSRLGDFAQRMHGEAIPPAPSIEPGMHRNIERFLGRPCSDAEARLRLGRYAPAEAAWWQELSAIIAAADGVRLLQVASPDFLSFRPFPGGATRAQTGQIGFRLLDGKVVPAMITTRIRETQEVLPVPVRWPLAKVMADG